MKALYRKYRPCKLADVVGQEQVTKVLANSLKQGKVSHAYLFIGPRGTGKTSVARIFAHEVNGFEYQLEDDYVDIIEIDGASNRGIDNIRELREKAAIAPTMGKYKIYIIDEVHMLTKEAFNALLKTLEEPPAHVIFIMATTDAYKVPITITSRAQTHTFRLADAGTMQVHLRKIADAENIKITDNALDIIVRRGGGSFRDSLSLLDQISTLSDDEITKELVVSAMGLPEDEKIAELLGEYINGDVVKITTLLKELISAGVKSETLAEEMIAQIIAEPRPELLPLLAKLPEVKAPFPEAKLLVALASGPIGAMSTFSNTKTTMATTKQSAQGGGILSSPSRPGVQPAAAPATSAPTTAESKQASAQATPEKATPSMNGSNASANAPFDWNAFTAKVQSLNDAIYSQLMKTSHEVVGDTLHIYPERKIVKTILSRDNNERVLSGASDGLKIQIHDIDERPNGAPKDEILDKISDIMGGKVQNDGGNNPFE